MRMNSIPPSRRAAIGRTSPADEAVRICLTVLLFAIADCSVAVAQHNARALASDRAVAASTPRREALFRNMPTNSGKRCLGIAVVAEALLDGVPLRENGEEEVAQIARRIYGGLTTGQRLRYPRQVTIEGKRLPIYSTAALDKLSTLVADNYKRDYSRLVKTDEGRRKVLVAQNSFVATSDALERLLDADPDKLDAFFGSGRRLFPDGTVKDTFHAFLIGKGADGGIVVYDPNEPGLPITGELSNTAKGVTLKWVCRYRDTGRVTAQRYLVVHKDKFFGVMASE